MLHLVSIKQKKERIRYKKNGISYDSVFLSNYNGRFYLENLERILLKFSMVQPR